MGNALNDRRTPRRGSALLVAIVATLVLAGMAGALMAMTGAHKRESAAATQDVRALYVAEAGLTEGIASVQSGAPADFGTAPAPIDFGGGAYWGTVVDNGDDTITVTSFGQVGIETRGIQGILLRNKSDLYRHALFAGNSSGDPLYELDFGGLGVQADQIEGDIYSGGGINISGDAAVNGDLTAAGTITGGSGDSGTLPIPDMAAMDYATNHDFNVATMFASGSAWMSDDLGGSAWQLPEASPAHIFRKNPSSRPEISGTVKDDYFLEDPYEANNTSSVIDKSAGAHITLSGQDGNPGPDGSNKIYFIDGNLWVHNGPMFSFTMYNSGPEPVRATFVVKGNVYLSDNVFYNTDQDAVAFIAIKDPAVASSGNVYFGDPSGGTLEAIHSFIYAENNFYDNNLSATGSKVVNVYGNMTAGNQVLINRDYAGQHSKLTVTWDGRLQDGAVTLPGLPGVETGELPYSLLVWLEVPAP